METRSKSAKKAINLVDKPPTVKELDNIKLHIHEEEPIITPPPYDGYDAIKASYDKLINQQRQIKELVKENTKELEKFESLYWKNKKHFTTCGYDHRVASTNCRFGMPRDIKYKYAGEGTAWIAHCEVCKRFKLKDFD